MSHVENGPIDAKRLALPTCASPPTTHWLLSRQCHRTYRPNQVAGGSSMVHEHVPLPSIFMYFGVSSFAAQYLRQRGVKWQNGASAAAATAAAAAAGRAVRCRNFLCAHHGSVPPPLPFLLLGCPSRMVNWDSLVRPTDFGIKSRPSRNRNKTRKVQVCAFAQSAWKQRGGRVHLSLSRPAFGG